MISWGQFSYIEKKVLDLENEVPEAKFTWSPNKEVRTISQVYSHVAYENYMFAKVAGITPPAGIPMSAPADGMKWEKSSTNKKTIHEQLVKSFSFVKAGVKDLSDDKLDDTVDFFGMKDDCCAACSWLCSATSMNISDSPSRTRVSIGVVPPWTAQENASAAQVMK